MHARDSPLAQTAKQERWSSPLPAGSSEAEITVTVPLFHSSFKYKPIYCCCSYMAFSCFQKCLELRDVQLILKKKTHITLPFQLLHLIHLTKNFTITKWGFSTPLSLAETKSSACCAYLLFLQFQDLLLHFCDFAIYAVHALDQFFLGQLGRWSILVLPTRLTRNWRRWSLMLSSKSRVLPWAQEMGRNTEEISHNLGMSAQ